MREARGRRPSTAQLALAVVALVALAALGAYFLMLNASVADKRAEADSLRAAAAARPNPAVPEPSGDDERIPSSSRSRRRARPRSPAPSAARAWDRLLREFSLVLPDDVSLDEDHGRGRRRRGRPSGGGCRHAARREHFHDRGLHEEPGEPSPGCSPASRCCPSSPPSISSRAPRRSSALPRREVFQFVDPHDRQAAYGVDAVKKQIPLTPVLAVALAIVLAVGLLRCLSARRRPRRRSSTPRSPRSRSRSHARRQRTYGRAAAPCQIDVADLFRLAKAMPDGEDMAGIMLELNSVAASAGIELRLDPAGRPAARSPATTRSRSTLTFQGNYYDLTDFLFRLRNLVTVRTACSRRTDGCTRSTRSTSTSPPSRSFPKIEAVLDVSAYSYGAARGADGRRARRPRRPGTTTDHGDRPRTTGETTTEQTPTNPPDAAHGGRERDAMSQAEEREADPPHSRRRRSRRSSCFVLVAVFLLAPGRWQGPGYLKMLTGGDEPAPPRRPTRPSPTARPARADPSTAPPPSTSVPGDPPAEVPADGSRRSRTRTSRRLADSGQLVSFDRFLGKDPFQQIVDTTRADSLATDAGAGAAAAAGPGGTPGPAQATTTGRRHRADRGRGRRERRRGRRSVNEDRSPKERPALRARGCSAGTALDRPRLGRVLERQEPRSRSLGRHAHARQPARTASATRSSVVGLRFDLGGPCRSPSTFSDAASSARPLDVESRETAARFDFSRARRRDDTAAGFHCLDLGAWHRMEQNANG